MLLNFHVRTLVCVGMCLSLLIHQKAQAQAQLGSGPSSSRTVQPFNPPGKIPSLSEILKNFHGSYGLSYMGPRINGTSFETYNIFLPDISSVQFFHTFELGYQVNDDLQIAVNTAAVQNLTDGVIGQTGIVYNRTFEWFDPNIKFKMPNLMKIPNWSVYSTASFSLPITQFSQDIKRITSIIITQSFTHSFLDSPFSLTLGYYLNPQLYNEPMPTGYSKRQTLYFSYGPTLAYQVSPIFSLLAKAQFDLEHTAPNPQGSFHFGESLPDFWQLTANLSPNIFPAFMTIGGYYRSLMWNPSFDTSIVGATFSIGF